MWSLTRSYIIIGLVFIAIGFVVWFYGSGNIRIMEQLGIGAMLMGGFYFVVPALIIIRRQHTE